MLCYWQEDGGSLLMTSFMAITEQRHKVPKLSERIFEVKNFCDFCDLTFGRDCSRSAMLKQAYHCSRSIAAFCGTFK